MDEGHSIIRYAGNKGIYQKSAVKAKKSSIQKLQNIQMQAVLLI